MSCILGWTYGDTGLRGFVISTGDLSETRVGDILQIKDSSGTYYHTYIVNSVTGSEGNRTNSDIWVCAHSANRRNEQLSTIIGSSQSNMRLIRITALYF